MIQEGTRLKVADNTGAKIVECFRVLGGTRKRYAKIGDRIKAAVKVAEPRKEVKTHDVVNAVVVRQKKEIKREDGSYIRFDENACCLINDEGLPRGNRILGPIPRELKQKGFDKIVTLAKDVV